MSRGTSIISVSEENRTFSVIVPRGCGADKIHVDDVANPEFASIRNRCDYAIRVSPNNPKHFFFIELKGNDVLKAVKQLRCTIEGLRNIYANYKDRQAWVIAKGYPAIVTTQLQKETILMKRDFSFVLKWKSRSAEVDVS